MTTAINLTTVTVNAQGATFTVDLSEVPAESLAIMVEYGVRRKYQDTVNSIAKKLRDEGEDVDGEALLADMHKRVVEGLLSTRGEAQSSDPLDAYRRAIVREIITADKESKAFRDYDAIDAKDRKARDAYLLELASKNAEAVDKLASARREADLAAKKAAQALSF